MRKIVKVILPQLRQHFEKIYGERLFKMVLFGSQARGDAKFGSDIDVLVVLKGTVNPGEEIKRTSHVVAQLSLEHNEVISRLFIDEHRFTHYTSPLLRNIRREGIVF
ncbi:MAG: nucleotidyltransferase domain-containing protein [Moorea sp. SIO2I5]|nr:nucleotidyltransferase domain-containing protein [Moorena sp. SIO2I5]